MNDGQCNFEEVEENLFRCMVCGREIRSKFSLTQIHVRCAKPEPKCTLEERQLRKSICKTCIHYKRLRCPYINLGCTLTYLIFLRSTTRTCPKDHWPIPSQIS